MAGKSKKQKLSSSNPRAPTKRTTAFASTSLSTASPILQSAFAPSWSKLSLFTSVLRGLDAQRLRCHDTATSRLQCEHVFDKNVEITSLSWGSLAEPDRDAGKKQKKKRKRASDANDAIVADADGNDSDGAQVVIAATSNTGKIFLYSPVQAEIVSTLEGGHVGPVTDFQFAESTKGVRAWSCGGNKLVEWDVKKGAPIRNIAFGETVNFYKTLPLPDTLVCASYSTYIVDINAPPTELASTFSSHSSQVHTLRRTAKQNKFLSAAAGDRFMYISDIKKEQSLGSLVAKGDVAKVDTTAQDNALVAVTADGIVELFLQPWSFQPASEDEGSSLKRKKAMTKTSETRIKIVRPDNQLVKVVDACFQGDSVLIAWAENATSVLFEKVQCLSAEGGLTINGDVVITKAKTVGIGGAAGGKGDADGIKDVSNVNLNQANTVVVEGADMHDIGMVDAPEKPRSDEEENDDGDAAAERESGSEREDNAEDDQEELTFEDRVKALTLTGDKSPRSNLSPSTNITVPSMEGAALITTSNKAVAFPNSTSLTTVLTQALKTDDRALLETCLQVTKVDMIESTIQRLDSLLAADLVMKLAEIIARKPGRAGSLMVWIQKTLVNHGGHLLTLPDLVHTMASLQRVLGKRAEALPKMLALRGRLSMLVAQMKLRSMAKDRLGAGSDVAVVYVEGVSKDDESSSDEAEDEVVDVGESDEEMSDNEEGVNGVLDLASEDDEEDEEESEEEDFGPGMYLDREAEETDDDSTGEDTDLDGFIVDDDEVDYESQDDDSEEEEEVAPKPVKKARGRLVKGSMLKR
ncbi:Small subunit (SSU) processome component [Orbilia brochopaga]|uniref:Small subunit (SSU) processome component n=1 Tax=Orbilia brochopaga TaxID=3140254 RepID=A0AAV9VBV5_9PEZI